jgi:lysophospholipase L1-like esterase
MQRNRALFRGCGGRAAILALAVAMAVAGAAMAPPGGQSASARTAQSRKMSYHDVRRGLFALSKFETAPIVMLGDSLTEAGPWSELTGCRLLANRGIGGDTTARVLGRLDEVLRLKPHAVFLMIGVNDISLHVAGETTVGNLRDILERLHGAATHTFMHYVLPVTASFGKRRMNGQIADLNAAVAGLVAGRPNTTAIDLRPLVADADGALREEFAWDGLHLSAKGYEVWRDAIAPQVAKYCVP